jgi:putative membrane protein
MKKHFLPFALSLSVIICSSCSNNNTSGSESTGDTTTASNSGMNTTDTTNNMSNNNTTTSTPTANTTPLNKSDSGFVMKAAMGGMMEVEAGNIATQNATNQRVKDFAAMMVRDHSQANNELKTLVSSRGITLPTALSADMQKHLDQMRKMTGSSFDKHYMSMMVEDHNKDVAEFKKQSTSATDSDLKNWAAKTLPVLQTHQDSAKAINKAKL